MILYLLLALASIVVRALGTVKKSEIGFIAKGSLFPKQTTEKSRVNIKMNVRKEEIVDWISRYKDGNINGLDYRREIIDTFVNSVYVYDDKLILTYNYKDGSNTLTLKEIEAALSSDLTSMRPPTRHQF